jgi:hypothetical protein
MAAVIVRPQLREAERQYLDLYAGRSHAITGVNSSELEYQCRIRESNFTARGSITGQLHLYLGTPPCR